MGLIFKQVWTSTGSSGPIGNAVKCSHGVQNITAYLAHSSLGANSQTFLFQTAMESSGPWFTEGSTVCSSGNVSTTFRLQITGPVAPWIRGFLSSGSTGNFTLLAIGMD